MRRRNQTILGFVLLLVVALWVLRLAKPPPSQSRKMGAVIRMVNRNQEIGKTEVEDAELKEYLEQLLEAIGSRNVSVFQELTRQDPKGKQFQILKEIFFGEGAFCPATILQIRRTQDTVEDLSIFPVDWHPGGLKHGTRMYSSSRHLVRVHSEPRARDYHFVIYNTNEGYALLLAGEIL